ncbi:aspartate/glutamate racemase family protein [Inquilinus limosus]|uniref:aspartate/glutamate racemase family protein n=1 Tax=Inquilinus limosus TaxID=171674 RepID=UPI003F179D59
MVLKIRLVAPTTDPRPETLAAIRDDLARLARPGVTLSHVQNQDGPLAVRSDADIEAARPGVLRRIEEAERDGIDAVIIDCTSDVGLAEARAAVAAIPVIGPGEEMRRLAGRRKRAWLDADMLAQDPLAHALAAVEAGATVLLVGSTGRAEVAARLRSELTARGHAVTVIEPLEAALDAALRSLGAGAQPFGGSSRK